MELSGGHGARASRGRRERGRRGPIVCHVPDAEAASGDTLGRPEVAGGGWQGAATVRECTVALSRAPIWLSRPFSMLVGVPLHVQ